MTRPDSPPNFNALVLHESSGHHVEFSQRAKTWLDAFAVDTGYVFDYITRPDGIDYSVLDGYGLVIQLDYPPYGWGEQAEHAFERYIEEGRGGWIGLHHASLLGEFDGYAMWQWFSAFLGGIRYSDYIASFARGLVNVEDTSHPVMLGVPVSFTVVKEEWYTYDKSPRPNVHVLATVDEASYEPDSPIKMGDHPVVWTNSRVAARNLYIFMGHSPALFDNPAYARLLGNAITWAAGGD